MSNDPVSIIAEILSQQPIPQVRRNVVAALGVLGGSESARSLAEIALNDGDKAVREAAERELAQTSDEKIASEVLDQALQVPDRAGSVYALMGRLRLHGLALHVAPPSTLTWLRLSLSLFKSAYPTRDWRFYLRTLVPAIIGAVVGMILFVAFLVAFAEAGMLRGVSSDMATIIFLALPVALVVGVAGSTLSTAFPLHYSQFAGTVAEVAWAASGVGVVAVILEILLVLLGVLNSFDSELRLLISFIAVMPIVAAAVRAGTIAVCGGSGLGLWDWLVSAIGGGMTGVFCITLISILLQQFNREVVSLLWCASVASCFALAAVHGKIDSHAPRVIRQTAKWPRLLVATVVTVVLVTTLAVILIPTAVKVSGIKPAQVWVVNPNDQKTATLTSLPYSVEVELPKRQVLRATIIDEESSQDRFWSLEQMFVLLAAENGKLIKPNSSEPNFLREQIVGKVIKRASTSIWLAVEPGKYTVICLSRWANQGLSPENALTSFLRSLAALLNVYNYPQGNLFIQPSVVNLQLLVESSEIATSPPGHLAPLQQKGRSSQPR